MAFDECRYCTFDTSSSSFQTATSFLSMPLPEPLPSEPGPLLAPLPERRVSISAFQLCNLSLRVANSAIVPCRMSSTAALSLPSRHARALEVSDVSFSICDFWLAKTEVELGLYTEGLEVGREHGHQPLGLVDLVGRAIELQVHPVRVLQQLGDAVSALVQLLGVLLYHRDKAVLRGLALGHDRSDLVGLL